jgi:hypothetical protein
MTNSSLVGMTVALTLLSGVEMRAFYPMPTVK